MDSLTQIVLGAAVGELVMGKKMGNRAMVWGAIGGTIPDLDIIANVFMSDIEALAVHRGISHSLFFAALFPWLLGWATHRIYDSGFYRTRLFRWTGLVIGLGIFVLIGGVFNLIVGAISGSTNYWMITLSVLIGGLFFFRVYQRQRDGILSQNIGYMDWVKLHFWAIFTHPLLDSCTTYGTQLFQPFSDYRVALNNISVADPAYTVPFLTLLVGASLLPKGNIWRKVLNTGGIIISCLYILWTFNNKFRVNHIFEENLAKQELVYDRYMTSPTILNNVLWYCIAEGDDHYYRGFYSFLDPDEIMEIDSLPKNRYLLEGVENERSIRILTWFSNDYYNTLERDDGRIQYNDLRFGAVGTGDGSQNPEEEFVFGFIIDRRNGLEVLESGERPSNTKEAFNAFWDRIKGKQ